MFLARQEVHVRNRSILLATLLALALTFASGVAACGGDDNNASGATAKATSSTATAAAAFPVTVTGDNGPITIARKPSRIVSLSASSTEDLFAIGAGDQVQAVDDQSNYPPEAPKTKLSGYTPNVEAIGGYEPDLVVMSSPDVAKELKAIKVPLLVLDAPKTIDGAYKQIELLGKATGQVEGATKIVAKMRSDIAEIVASVTKPATPAESLTYYHELDDTFYTVTSKTFIGNVYGLLGLKNIADPADKGTGGYPQLSAEYLLSADPDLVFLADTKCCKQSAATAAKRPGWDQLQAVKNGHVVALDDDVASRWGPRVVDFLRTIATEVQTVEKKAA
jgi:iron complex transport system substrate-binding protein